MARGENDYVDMPGVTPITSDLFPAGTPPNPTPPGVNPAVAGNVPPQPPINNTPSVPTSPLGLQPYAAGMIQGLENRKGITAAEGANQMAGMQANADILGGGAAGQQEQIDHARALMNEAIDKANKHEQELRGWINQSYQEKVDPNRYWNSKSTGDKVLAGVGMILGGFGAGLASGGKGGGGTGENPALAIINKAINDDIAAQAHDIDHRLKVIQEARGLNNDSFNRDLQRQAWENNYRISGLEVIKLQLGEAAAKTQNQSVKNNALSAIQDLTDKQLQIRNGTYNAIASSQAAQSAKYEKLAGERRAASNELLKSFIAGGYSPEQAIAKTNEKLDADFPQLKGTPWASPGQKYNMAIDNATGVLMKTQGISRDQAQKMAKDLLSQNGIKDPYAVAGGGMLSKEDQARSVVNPVSGESVVFPDKEMANKYRSESASIEQARQYIKELQGIRSKYGGGFSTTIHPDDARRAAIINQQLVGALNQMGNAGVLNEAEYKRVSKILPDATSYDMLQNVNTQLGDLDSILQGQQAAKFRAYSGQPSVGSVGPGQIPPKASPADPFVPYGQGNFPNRGGGGTGGMGGGNAGGARGY